MTALGDWLQSISIGRRLGWAFASLVALMILFGAVAIHEMGALMRQTVELIEHPFTVTRAVDEVEEGVLQIQIEMNALADARDFDEILEHERHMDEHGEVVLDNLTIVKDRFLGSPEEVADIEQAFVLWRPTRQKVVELRLAERYIDAEDVIRTKSALQVAELLERLEALKAFAKNKAEEFEARSHEIARQGKISLIALLAIGALFATLIAIAITGSIRRPLRELGRAAQDVEAGDLERQAKVETKDELGELAGVFNGMVRSIRNQTAQIARQNEENEALLLNILPGPIAERLKRGEESIADHFPDVTVLFADIAGFTPMSARLPAGELVEILNLIFSAFDEAAKHHGVEKIKTIGDSYMAVTGLTQPLRDNAVAMVEMAFEMLEAIDRVNRERGTNFSLRVGINAGPVVAGVIGRSKFIYDLWGDTVNLASRMESHGVAGRVQVTEEIYHRVKDHYAAEPRGKIEVKGKGKINAYLIGRLEETAAA
ncbi:MAG: adenylate/guanylate cyclase domain-containing protein [Pseudomonadota bacterium]